ncbi:MAG: hypothetical protein MJZ26_05450 [Fibrobacter sp.]|nr:hypothetical protein [Fibrobacter sp.]
MLKRNFLLILLVGSFVALLAIPFSVKTSKVLPPSIEPVSEENVQSFTGRMVMPSLDDFYVLENSAGRDLAQLEKYLQGRAAGLHWLASEHFKKQKKSKNKSDVYMGLKLTLDSLGRFVNPEVLFSNSDSQELKSLVCEHIQAYWRYPRSAKGKLEVFVPIIWTSKY